MQADHDKALQSVFEKFAATELTINKPKCEFSKHSHILRQRNLTWSEESTSNSEYQSAHVDKWCPKFPGNGDVLRKVYSEFQWSVATTTGAHKERCPVQVDCWTQSSFCVTIWSLSNTLSEVSWTRWQESSSLCKQISFWCWEPVLTNRKRSVGAI